MEINKETTKELKKFKENNKYYSPTIEEFSIGLEYIFFDTLENNSFKTTFDINTILEYINMAIEKNIIRIEILNQNDLIKLGFKKTANNFFSNEDGVIIEFFKKNKISKFPEVNINKYEEELFSGYIKNKLELTKLLKQINIQLMEDKK